MKRWVQFIFLLLAAVAALASYGLFSPFAPEEAYNAYGGAIERLDQRLPDFYGGSGQSAAYQVTYGTLSAATVFIGTEFGQAGRLGRSVAWAAERRLAAEVAQQTAETAAKTAARNPNVYEVLFEAPVTGTTRTAHRTSANQFLANQLMNDAQLSGMFNQVLGGNVLEHMQSGRSGLINPPGTVWHHPFENPNVLQLLRGNEHTARPLQTVLHPGGRGGYGNYYGP